MDLICRFIQIFTLMSMVISVNGYPLIILLSDAPSRIRRPRFLGGIQECCQDLAEVSNKSRIQFPLSYRHISRPWMRADLQSKLFTSEILQYNWFWMKSLRVRGFQSITVDDVLSRLESAGCLFLPWGGSVRDAVLGRNPTDIDGEATCDAFKIREVCLKHFDASNCGHPPYNNLTRMLIGNPNYPIRRNELMADSMDLAQWNSTFNVPPTEWEYTANALGLYDNQRGRVYLIDMTGRGMSDTCDRRIDITVPKEDWNSWANGDLVKLLRYYKLRIHEFRPAKHVGPFIIQEIKNFFSVRKMQQFYCKYVVDGTFVWFDRPLPDMPSSDEHFCTSRCTIAPLDDKISEEISKIENALKEDFGYFFYEEMRPAINAMEMQVIPLDRKESEQENHRENEQLSYAVHQGTIHAPSTELVSPDREPLSETALQSTTDAESLETTLPAVTTAQSIGTTKLTKPSATTSVPVDRVSSAKLTEPSVATSVPVGRVSSRDFFIAYAKDSPVRQSRWDLLKSSRRSATQKPVSTSTAKAVILPTDMSFNVIKMDNNEIDFLVDPDIEDVPSLNFFPGSVTVKSSIRHHSGFASFLLLAVVILM